MHEGRLRAIASFVLLTGSAHAHCSMGADNIPPTCAQVCGADFTPCGYEPTASAIAGSPYMTSVQVKCAWGKLGGMAGGAPAGPMGRPRRPPLTAPESAAPTSSSRDEKTMDIFLDSQTVRYGETLPRNSQRVCCARRTGGQPGSTVSRPPSGAHLITAYYRHAVMPQSGFGCAPVPWKGR